MRGVHPCLLMLLVMAGDAFAQTRYTLAPNPASEGQSISLRVDDASGCFPAIGFDVLSQQDSLDVLARMTDAGPCLPQFATPRFVALAGLDAGMYQVRIFRCGNAPPPAPECALDATLSLTVVGASAARVVPTLSALGAAVLGMGMLGLAVCSAGRRIRSSHD